MVGEWIVSRDRRFTVCR